MTRQRRDGNALRREGQQAQQHHGQRRVLVGQQVQLRPALQSDAVEQLSLIGGHLNRQVTRRGAVRVAVVERTRHGLLDGHLLQQHGHFFERA